MEPCVFLQLEPSFVASYTTAIEWQPWNNQTFRKENALLTWSHRPLAMLRQGGQETVKQTSLTVRGACLHRPSKSAGNRSLDPALQRSSRPCPTACNRCANALFEVRPDEPHATSSWRDPLLPYRSRRSQHHRHSRPRQPPLPLGRHHEPAWQRPRTRPTFCQGGF